jgi:catechol 2,3-dioxygenase-like lactoylglutathione lyase family enzyme
MSIVRHTHNYEAMVRFYREALGMELVESWDQPGNRGALLSPGENVGTAVIEVLELGAEAKPGFRPENIVLSIKVDEVDAWHRHLTETGVVIARGLADAPWGHRSFGVDDPDGFRIWFYQDVKNQ